MEMEKMKQTSNEIKHDLIFQLKLRNVKIRENVLQNIIKVIKKDKSDYFSEIFRDFIYSYNLVRLKIL